MSRKLALKLILITAFCLLLPAPGGAKTNYTFHKAFHLGGQASYNVIEDRDGFLWFTSMMSGLIRYDGTGTKVFRAGPDSIASDFTTQIFEDLKGRIWIGTNNGLSRYDKSANDFTTFYKDPKNLKNSLAGNGFNHSGRTIASDSEGNLWFGTQTGLTRYDLDTEEFTSFFHDPDNSHSLSGDNIFSVYSGSKGYIWVGSRPGVTRIDPKTLSLKHYLHDANNPDSLPDNNIQTIVEDRNGNIWMATMDNGLIKMDRQTGQFKQFKNDPDDPSSFPAMTIWNLVRLKNGKFAVGTDTNPIGLFLWDPIAESYEQILANPSVPLSLSGNNVQSHFEDKRGNLYIVLSHGLIDRYAPGVDRFKAYRANIMDPNSISSGTSYAIHEDSQGQIWVGHFGEGLDLYDPQTDTFKNFTHQPGNPKSIPHGYVSGFLHDSKGRMIASTMLGMAVWDPLKKEAVELITKDTWLFNFHQDLNDPDLIYGVGWEQGLHRYNLKTDEHKIYQTKYDDPESIGAITAMHVIGDPVDDRYLWIATWGGGLNRYDQVTEKFLRLTHDPENPNSISSDTVYNCFIDSLGNFWVTTDRGLDLFDSRHHVFERIAFDKSLFPRQFAAIMEDKHQNLWLGTDVGLLKFDIETRKVLKVFTEEDGLPGHSYFPTSKLQSSTGDFYLGGSGMGLIRFNPENFVENNISPKTVLTSLKQNGNEMILPQAVELTNKISLDWKNNNISFEYVALNFSNSLKNRYKYFLEGYDGEWFYAQVQRFGRYANLPGGTYTLRIKGSNNDGYWSKPEQEVALKIVVAPPPWLRWWAYLTYFAILVFGIAGVITLSLNRAKARQKELEAQVAEKTAELQVTLETKERFFSIIAHDLKGPIGSLSVIFNEILKGPQSMDLQMFHTIRLSAKNTYQLLENLLTWSRNQKGQLEYNCVHFSIAHPIEQCLKLQKSQALQKGVRLTWEGERDLFARADLGMVTTILRNLISNAVKFTSEGDLITISTQNLGEQLQISIQDTGVGMPEKTVSKLFKIDSKVESSPGTNMETGSGLGLILCADFVQKNNGRIWVESEPGKGSCFYFTLDKGEQRFEETGVTAYLPGHWKELTCLIAEDNPLHQKTSGKVFSDLGLKYEMVANGRDAVERVKEGGIDIVFMDYDMPELDGVEALRIIRGLEGTLPKIVALTSYLEVELSDRLLNMSFEGYLNKPLSQRHLQKCLAKLFS